LLTDLVGNFYSR